MFLATIKIKQWTTATLLIKAGANPSLAYRSLNDFLVRYYFNLQVKTILRPPASPLPSPTYSFCLFLSIMGFIMLPIVKSHDFEAESRLQNHSIEEYHNYIIFI